MRSNYRLKAPWKSSSSCPPREPCRGRSSVAPGAQKGAPLLAIFEKWGFSAAILATTTLGRYQAVPGSYSAAEVCPLRFLLLFTTSHIDPFLAFEERFL